MSGLSMADMRRIGQRRNTETISAEPTRSGLLPKLNVNLPFSGRASSNSTSPGGTTPPPVPARGHSAINRLEALQTSQAAPSQQEPVQAAALPQAADTPLAMPVAPAQVSVNTDPFAEAPTQLSAMTSKQAEAPLRSDTNVKGSIGAGMGAAAGFAATGMLMVAPAGLMVGGMSGLAVAKRNQSVTALNGRKISIKRKQAETLISAFEETCMPLGVNTPKISLSVDQSAGLHIVSAGKPNKRKLEITVGLALLAGLSVQQLQALFAQGFGRLLAAEKAQGEIVQAETVATLDHMHDKKAARVEKAKAAGKATKQFDRFERHVHSARFAWSNTVTECDRMADSRAAAIVGSSVLVDAILAQGLIAQRFNSDEGQSYEEQIEALRRGYDQAEMDEALRGLATTQVDARQFLKGLPLQLLERVTALDTSTAVPKIPALGPAFRSLDGATQVLLDKKLGGLKPERSVKKDKPAKAKNKAKTPKAAKVSKPGLLARLRKKDQTPNLAAMEKSAEPLYDADTLFKSDAGVGLEAYQSLVDANPRWALARLRLAEAQIESGQSDGVANLMIAAEQLPSAMPTILDMLHGARPMVSPLEEEPMRQVIERMSSNADAMAAERAQIDLARLEAPRMDETDMITLQNLFADVQGLREAWVFNVPCIYVPEVPHHAIIGLAPRLPDEDAEMLAMQLAEHAAILGTVAVHVETGTPNGGLSDALASQPSLWRTGMITGLASG